MDTGGRLSYSLLFISYFHGCALHFYPQLQHEPYPGKRYPAGDARTQVFARAGVPVPAACEGFAGEAGHSAAQIQNRHFYSWLLLAWARRM